MLEVSQHSGGKCWRICWSKSNDLKCSFSIIRSKEGDFFYVWFYYLYLMISLVFANINNPHNILASHKNCDIIVASLNKVF